MANEPMHAQEPHTLSAGDVARQLHVSPEQGLAADQIDARRLQHGPNVLTDNPPHRFWQRILDQCKDFMVLVLLAAAVLSGFIGDVADTLTIVLIVLLNAAIGIAQEWRADQAMQALRQLDVPHARVLREGRAINIEARELVPGDIVYLEAGDMIPADLRLNHVAQLRVDESTLPGESVTVHKDVAPIPSDSLPLGDRLNMAFKGTLVTNGRGTGIVVATGPATQLGKVASLMQADGARSTPLQRRLAAFGKRLSLVVLAICVVIFMLGVLRGESWLLMALTAISLAVAAIPEALPAVVTVLLALGARAMVRVNALVRRLPSVETLGSVTTICSDKTGTLTLNRMRVQAWHTWRNLPVQVLWRAVSLCNDAVWDDARESWLGDPTEVALVEQALSEGLDVAALRGAQPRVLEFPFDAERKRMTTVHANGDAARESWVAMTKGAPETVLPRCVEVLTDRGTEGLDADEALETARSLAAQGMRVLAVAQRKWCEKPGSEAADVEQDLTLLGLVGLLDPPRPEARKAVAECLAAGITPVMITGDHPATALAIARELGITDNNAKALTGAELGVMTDDALKDAVKHVRVYARMDPAQKIRIVHALQWHGECVAMTGDGVNDAPALRSADIGVAMGRNGTDVAREAASLVLMDDNFATIVAAVREGRRIFDNIRKFIRYAMTGNSGEIWTLFLAPLVGLPTPLLPIHILWVNLVTDGLPGLALAAEPAERGVMQRPPRPPAESVFAHGLWHHTLWVGLLIAFLCLGVQAWALANANPHVQTMVFTVLTLTQMAHVMAIRSERASLFTQGLRSNLPLLGAVVLTFALQLAVIYLPAFQTIFHTRALTLNEFAECMTCAMLVFFAVELEKAWQRR